MVVCGLAMEICIVCFVAECYRTLCRMIYGRSDCSSYLTWLFADMSRFAQAFRVADNAGTEETRVVQLSIEQFQKFRSTVLDVSKVLDSA